MSRTSAAFSAVVLDVGDGHGRDRGEDDADVRQQDGDAGDRAEDVVVVDPAGA